MYVTYACACAHICLFLIHPYKFLYVKHWWTNKGCFWNEKASGFNANLQNFEKCQWKLYFEFSVALRGHQQTTVLLTLDWSKAPKKLRRKLKQLLKLLILANCFFYGILHVIFTWQKTVSCLFNGKILSLSCPVAKCLFQLCLVWRHAHVYCICTFKIKSSFLPSGKMSSHWNNEDLLRKEETIH